MSRPTPVERMLQRAALYRLCASALGYPLPGRLAEVARLAGRAAQAAEGALRARLVALVDAMRDVDDAAAAAEYVALFDGAVRCPSCEGAYGPPQMAGKAAQLADIGGFYAAFGLEPAREQADVEDHIATELEFMSLLAVKEAWALAEGHHEQAEISRDAAVAFLTDHLGRWAAAFATTLAETSALPYYRAVAGLLDTWVSDDALGLGATLTPLATAPGDRAEADSFDCPLTTDPTLETDPTPD
jgi:TorA maturation chaperone TorD